MRFAGFLLAACCGLSVLAGAAEAAGLAASAQKSPAKSGASPVLPGGNSRAPISVDAAKLEYFDKDQKLIYSGGVLAKQGESTMRASAMVVYLLRQEEQGGLQAESGRIRRIEASGPVTVTVKLSLTESSPAVWSSAPPVSW